VKNFMFGCYVNMAGAVHYGLDKKLDLADFAILSYISGWQTNKSRNGKVEHYEGEDYVWIDFSYMIDQIPMLGIKSKSPLSFRIDNLVKCGLIKTRRLPNYKLYITTTNLASNMMNYKAMFDGEYLMQGSTAPQQDKIERAKRVNQKRRAVSNEQQEVPEIDPTRSFKSTEMPKSVLLEERKSPEDDPTRSFKSTEMPKSVLLEERKSPEDDPTRSFKSTEMPKSVLLEERKSPEDDPTRSFKSTEAFFYKNGSSEKRSFKSTEPVLLKAHISVLKDISIPKDISVLASVPNSETPELGVTVATVSSSSSEQDPLWEELLEAEAKEKRTGIVKESYSQELLRKMRGLQKSQRIKNFDYEITEFNDQD